MLTEVKNLDLSRYEYAADAIGRYSGALPSKTVIDAGAGDGRMREPIEQRGLFWRGFDLVPSCTDVAFWNLEQACPLQAGSAGAAILLDVVEHLFNPGLALLNISRALQPGGILILTAPNPRWSRSRIHALLHGNPACFTQDDLDLNHHVFTPWPHIMTKALNGAGLEVFEYATLDGKTTIPKPELRVSYPLRLGHAIVNKTIEARDPTACGMSFGMLSRKLADVTIP